MTAPDVETLTINGIHYRQVSDEVWAWMVDDNPNGWVWFSVYDQENGLLDALEALAAERDDLARWKTEALTVIEQWETGVLNALGYDDRHAVPIPLGASVAGWSATAVEALAAENRELRELRAEVDDLHENLIRVMKQRNAQTFAMQCFHSHAVKDGEPEAAERIADYLTAAGHLLAPQHWLIDSTPSAALADEGDG